MRLEYNVLTMKWLQQRTNIEDRAVPDLLLSGLPIVGKGLTSTFFVDAPPSAAIPLQHLLMGALPRRQRLAKRFMSGPHTLAEVNDTL
eukprot:3837122-Amphidinium_carterae.1